MMDPNSAFQKAEIDTPAMAISVEISTYIPPPENELYANTTPAHATVESIPHTTTIGELSAEDSFVCGVYASTKVPNAFIHNAAGLPFNIAKRRPCPEAGHVVDAHADAEKRTDSSSCCSESATVAQNAAANWKKADMSITYCFAPVPIWRSELEASKFAETANPTAPPNPVETKDETLMYA